MASPLTAAKKQLRTLVKQRLAKIPHDSVIAQSRTIFEALQDFRPYQEANRISVYLSMPTGEVQTDAIVRHALKAGKQVFVPFLHKSPLEDPNTPARVMDMVLLKGIQDYDSLERDSWGIPSINPATIHERQRIFGEADVHRSDLDLMLMPGVVFDVDDTGCVRRLGHGKGFYDFFLNRYLAAKTGTTTGNGHGLQFYGLALTEQLLDTTSGEQIPMGPYDRKLHGLILGDGEIKTSADSQAISA